MTTPLAIALPADFRWQEVFAYHGRDAGGPAERVTGMAFTKAVTLAGVPFAITLDLSRTETCRVLVDPPSPAETACLLAGRLLGLHTDPAPFRKMAGAIDVLAPLVAARPGLRVVRTATPFEALAWAIVGQQVTLGFAVQLRRALIETCGRPAPSGLIAFPGPEQVASVEPDTLGRQRFSRAKAETLVTAARAIVDGRLPFDDLAEGRNSELRDTLMSIKGVGPWTADYVLLRGFGVVDAAPFSDAGLDAALRRLLGYSGRLGPKAIESLLEPYRPWRGIACCHLWASLAASSDVSLSAHVRRA